MMEMANVEEKRKKGLAWYSKFVYPLFLGAFIWVVLYFEFARQDNWKLATANAVPMERILERFYELQMQFFISIGAIFVVTMVWVVLVARDKRLYPEKYRKY